MFPFFHFRVLLIRSIRETSQKGTSGLNSPAPLLLQVCVSSVGVTTTSLAFCFPGAGWATEAWWAGEGRGYYPGLCTCGSVWCQQNPRRPTAETQSPVKWWWGLCSEGIRREGSADSRAGTPGGHPAWCCLLSSFHLFLSSALHSLPVCHSWECQLPGCTCRASLLPLDSDPGLCLLDSSK